jgi:WD40 repeat protein
MKSGLKGRTGVSPSTQSSQRPVHQGAIISCAFVGGPNTLATGSVEGAIAIWDLAAGACTERFQAHHGPVTALAWDGRRRRLVSGGHDRQIVITEPETGQVVMRPEGCEGGLFSMAISPDGETLASGGFDRVIRLWRLANGAPLGALPGHQGAVTDVDFLDNGRLVSCGRDDKVVVWDLDRRTELCRTAGHQRWAMSVRASADGERVFSAGEDGLVCCWSASTGKRVWCQQQQSPIWGLERTPDGRALIVGMGGGVLQYDLGQDSVAKVTPIAPETARAMARCEDGLIAMGADTVMLYRPGRPEEPVRRLHTGAVHTSAVAAVRAPDGRIATVLNRHHGQVEFDFAGRRTMVDPPHNGLAFTACAVGEALFATAGFDGKVHLRATADGVLHRTLDHEGFIFTVCASADGARLLTAGNDRLALWEVATGRRLWAGRDLGVGFHCWATLSARGDYALMVGEDQGLHRWTFSEGQAMRSRLPLDSDPLIGTCGLMGVAVLDEKTVAIASSTGEVHSTDLATGSTKLLHAVHESGVRVLALSPDRRRLLSFSENCVAVLYDLAAGVLCTPAAMAASVVPAAAFTARGDLVWADGEAVLHTLTPEALNAPA